MISRVTLAALCGLWSLSLTVRASEWEPAGVGALPPVYAPVTSTPPAVASTPLGRSSRVWQVAVDYLYWQPHMRGFDFATLENQAQAVTLGAGQVHNLQPDRDSGFRLGIGRCLEDGWGAAFRFTDFSTDSQDSLDAPVNSGLSMFATRGHPDNQLEQATHAEAIGNFDYRVFDAEASRLVSRGVTHDFRIFGGLRWANVNQRTQYRYDGLDFSQAEFVDSSKVQIFGLRGGGEAIWKWTSHWQAFGRLGGTVGWGQMQTHWTERNFNNTQLLVDIQDNFNQALPSIDMALGVEWRHRFASFAGGYEAIHWFNLVSRSNFPDDFEERFYVPTSNDLLLEGLFLRLTLYR